MASFDQGYWCTPGHVITAAVGLFVMDVTFITLRFIARKKQRQPLKVDDWITIPAILFALGISISMLYGVSQKAIGYPYVIPPEAQGNSLLVATEQISLAGQIQWTFFLLLPLTLGCTKMSFLFLYKRVFAINQRGATNILIVGMIVLIAIWMAGFFLTSLFQCKLDFWALWNSPIDQVEHCISATKLALALIITDFGTDIFIMAIPIPLVWRLNLSTTKKIAITGVFLLGAISVAVSLLRLILTERLLRFGFDPHTDAILLITSIQYWGMVESGVAVVAACLPTLWILVKGWSWDPITKAAKDLADFSNSSFQRLRSQISKREIVTDSLDREYIRLAIYQTDKESETRVKGDNRKPKVNVT
ncbi:hypothetical protein F5Y04DRAFT_288906 [Hypomontagnella monticulosa]|nr:hypothetical protein F5Y04DRAFT_288906 [Hypomontagnella monticulosa]